MRYARVASAVAIALSTSQLGYSCYLGGAAAPSTPPSYPAANSPCPRVTIPPDTIAAYPMLPDVLGSLKMLLRNDSAWPTGPNTLQPSIRHQMAFILEDPNLVFEFSPPLVPVAHLGSKVIAAQTIDGHRIRLSRFAAGPSQRDPVVLAQTVAHELLHVFQVRHQGKSPNSLFEPAWEVPAYAFEAQMPAGAFQGPLAACTTPPPAQPMAGPCRPRQVRPGPRGMGEWVAWSTPTGWLRVGRETDLARPQRQSEDIWGGTSAQPLVKTRLALGPWWSREQAIEEIASELANVVMVFSPTAAPKEVTQGMLRGGRYYLRLVYGEPGNGYAQMDYAVGQEIEILKQNGISPRVVFGSPKWLLHLRRGTNHFWTLFGSAPRGNGIELPDGTGGTFGYSVESSEGPFTDSFPLYPAILAKGMRRIDEFGSVRTVSADWAIAPYVDHGTPLCP